MYYYIYTQVMLQALCQANVQYTIKEKGLVVCSAVCKIAHLLMKRLLAPCRNDTEASKYFWLSVNNVFIYIHMQTNFVFLIVKIDFSETSVPCLCSLELPQH